VHKINEIELSGRFLIVDDEEHIRLVLSETMGSTYELTLRTSGESAIEAINASLQVNQPFAVAIIDLNMTGISGTETARKIRILDERIHLILMTGETGSVFEIVDDSLRQNVILVRKPFSVDELLMLTQYLYKTWHLARTLELKSDELNNRIKQSEAIRANIEAIFETALDCIITIDHQSRVTEWNPAAEKTFGWTRDQILGMKLSETIIPPDYRNGHAEGMKKHLKFGGGPILGKRIEIFAQNSKGHIFPVELAVTQIEDAENPGFTAYLRDISAERAAERQMKLQSKTLEAAANGIIITDVSGRMIWVNPAFLALTGYTNEEVVGKSTRMLKSGEHDDNFYADLWETILDGKVWNGEIINRRKDGSQYPEDMTVTPITDDNSNIINFISIKQDVTERKRAEQALKESVHIKTNFVSNVSHELRTPMASILGFAGTILRDKDMPDDTKMEFVGIINEEAQRLTRLIENVLDISKMEAGTIGYKMQTTHLEDVISEVIASQNVLAQKKDISLQFEIGKNLEPIKADSDAISQLAVNLISNAIKFTEPSGSVKVKLSKMGKTQIFEVSDTGLGIPEADIAKIFDKFYRVEREKRQDAGTGIGLAIVKEIADMHKAKLEVESAVGKGTTFRVILPL